MNKEKIIVYPYDGEFTPVLRHSDFLSDYEIAGLVAPGGWGLTGRDVGEADGGSDLGIFITSDFTGSLDTCDTVMFCESHTSMDFNRYILPKANEAMEAGKNIVLACQAGNDIQHSLLKACESHGLIFRCCYGSGKEEAINRTAAENETSLYDIDVPVIFVLGIGERTGKFEVQLALRENILKKGYRICQIGTREYCEILGFHSFPQFMYSETVSEGNKIVAFNHFVKRLELEEQPDVIIIGVPGGIMPFNNKMTNRFGILAYELSQALTPDSAVCSCYYSEYSPEYFARLKDSLKYRLGCNVDCYHLSNTMIDWESSKFESKMVFTSLGTEFIDEKLKKYEQLDIPVFNLLGCCGTSGAADCLINKLEEYGMTECL